MCRCLVLWEYRELREGDSRLKAIIEGRCAARYSILEKRHENYRETVKLGKIGSGKWGAWLREDGKVKIRERELSGCRCELVEISTFFLECQRWRKEGENWWRVVPVVDVLIDEGCDQVMESNLRKVESAEGLILGCNKSSYLSSSNQSMASGVFIRCWSNNLISLTLAHINIKNTNADN